MNKNPTRFIQLTDLHIRQNMDAILHEINPYQNLKLITTALQKENFDFILLSGDIADDGSKEAYQHIKNLLATLDKPIYALPGNHDDPKILSQELNYQKEIEINSDWKILALNSVVAGEHAGNLAAEELSFLKETIKKHADKNLMIALHHHPVSINSPWMDKYMLKNASAFLEVVLAAKNVRLVIFGHVHQVWEQTISQARFLSAPSTFIQFYPGAISAKYENLAPGYRWFEFDGATYYTGVQRIVL